MFQRLGEFVSRHSGWVLAFWIVLAAIVRFVAPSWSDVAHDGDLAYMPDRMPSVQGERLLSEAFPNNRAKSQIVLVVAREGGQLTGDDFAIADKLAEHLQPEKVPDLPILNVLTRENEVIGSKLRRRTATGEAVLIISQLSNEFMATDNIRILNRIQQIVDEVKQDPGYPEGLEIGITGSAAIGGDMLSSAAESIKSTELLTIVLVLGILGVVYRAPLLVIVPLATIGLSLVVSTGLVALLTQLNHVPGFGWWDFKVFTTTRIFIVVILFGAGTDFCLFLIARYKEELEASLDKAAAVSQALSQVSHALVGSAATTIFGLGTMVFADFGKFRNSGPAIALCLAVTLLACLTFAPALLRVFGTAVFWPFSVVRQPLAADQVAVSHDWFSRFWHWISGVIVARPGLILVASIVVMLPLAVAGGSVEITYDLLNELAPERTSVVGTRLLHRYFAPGETGPITVLALRDDGKFATPDGERDIALLTKLLYDLEGVDRVRSITEPLGDKPGFFQPFSAAGQRKLAARKHPQTTAMFLTQAPDLVGDVARFDVVIDRDAFSREAIDVLDHIDEKLGEEQRVAGSPAEGVDFFFSGTTAGTRDLRAVTASDTFRIQCLVVLAVLAVLILLLRQPVVCIYLILSVLFSYYVTIGATELVFAWHLGSDFQGLDWKVPIFLFVILVAVGEDYNIYLVTRVVEEQQKYGPLEGLRRAVERTGGIITSCGVIMAGTFVSMMSGTLRGVQELGFALSFGVLLDTLVVRTMLVPAFLALLVRWRGTDATPSSPLIPAASHQPGDAVRV